MDLKNLRTFIYVAELGSFTKAARQLGFAQIGRASCRERV